MRRLRNNIEEKGGGGLLVVFPLLAWVTCTCTIDIIQCIEQRVFVLSTCWVGFQYTRSFYCSRRLSGFI